MIMPYIMIGMKKMRKRVSKFKMLRLMRTRVMVGMLQKCGQNVGINNDEFFHLEVQMSYRMY